MSLDIVDPDAGACAQEQEDEDDIDRLIEEIYDTLNIDSDDSPGARASADAFDDIHRRGFHDLFGGDEDEDDSDCSPCGGSPRGADVLSTEESDDDELEVSEIEIDSVKYYTTDERSGKIYHVLANDDIGERVGVFNEGIATFY